MAQQPKGPGRQLVVYKAPGTPGAHQPRPTTGPTNTQNIGGGAPTPTSVTIQLKSMDWRWLAGAVALVLGLMLGLRSVTTSLPTTWWLWALVLGGLATGLYFAHKKNDIGASIIKYSLMGLVALVLATWLGLGNVAKVGQNIGDDLAGNNPARTVTRAAPAAVAPSRPEGASPSVVVPACGSAAGWSEVIPIPAFWNITSAWNMNTVTAAWREDGQWKQFPDKYLSGSFDAVKYCTPNSSYAGETMLLTWSQR